MKIRIKFIENNNFYLRRISMERVYNKLVRDNIPEIRSKNKEIPVIRILNDVEYK